jgi:hypothetical protein
MTTPSEVLDGVDLNGLGPGSLIDVETRNHHYHIECLGGNTIRISGHPEYCPQPVTAHLHGPIEPGTRLKFLLDDARPITTSRVVSFHVDPPTAAASKSPLHVN